MPTVSLFASLKPGLIFVRLFGFALVSWKLSAIASPHRIDAFGRHAQRDPMGLVQW